MDKSARHLLIKQRQNAKSAARKPVCDLFRDPLAHNLAPSCAEIGYELATRSERAGAAAYIRATFHSISDRAPFWGICKKPLPPARTFVRSATELLGHLFGGGAWN
jgi:hypothetical protein